MAGVKLSRRKIAAHLADELVAGRPIAKQLAAYLVETRRTREATLMVRDIESALADRGVLLADVSTSRELATDTKAGIRRIKRRITIACRPTSPGRRTNRHSGQPTGQNPAPPTESINSKQDIRNQPWQNYK